MSRAGRKPPSKRLAAYAKQRGKRKRGNRGVNRAGRSTLTYAQRRRVRKKARGG